MADRVRFGVHRELEEEATALILASLEGVTSRDAKSDILTPWKDKHRHTHEILVTSGAPDPAVRRGQFSKAYNRKQTHLNSYECATRPIKMSTSWDPDDASPDVTLSSGMAEVAGVERIDD